jgi:hypothetical protein
MLTESRLRSQRLSVVEKGGTMTDTLGAPPPECLAFSGPAKSDRRARRGGPTPVEVEQALAGVLAGIALPEGIAARPFDHRYLIVRPSSDVAPLILEVKHGDVVEPTREEYVAGHLVNYLSSLGETACDYALNFRRCRDVVARWQNSHVDLSEMPKAVSFKSDAGYCLARQDFDPVACSFDELAEAAPTFVSMLTRITNADAFCMRIGSIFDADADRKQAVWMSGPPDCGKSQFLWLIERLTGKAFFPVNAKTLKSEFWGEPLIGKRVALVQEAPADFIRSEMFKAITGDTTHPINRKGRPVILCKLALMLFFFSNEEPTIPPDEALMLRIIDCRVSPLPVGERVGEVVLRERLEMELPYIAGYCMARYRTLERGGRIPCDSDELRRTAGATVADVEDFIEHHVVAGSPADYFTRQEFKDLMIDHNFRSSLEQAACKAAMKRAFSATETRREFPAATGEKMKRLWVYEGVRLKTEEERRYRAGENVRARHGSVLALRPGRNPSEIA